MNRGYIKVWRKISDNDILKNHKYCSFFLWCLVKAAHKDKTVIVGSQPVEIKAGEFVFGRKSASKSLAMGEQEIRTCVKLAQNLNFLTTKSTNKYTVISIINWDIYQGIDDNSQPSNQPTPNQQLTNNQPQIKNVKNVKNNKTLYSECVLLADDEYQKLISKFGELLTKSAIEFLSNYILSSGKKYKSHYHTLLLWPMDRAREQQQGVNYGRGKGVSNGGFGNKPEPAIIPEYTGDDIPTEEERQRGLQRLKELTGRIG